MRVTLNAPRLLLAAALSLAGASAASAESAFVEQVRAGVAVPVQTLGTITQAPASFGVPSRGQPTVATPQNAAPGGGNLAQTLQVGAFNRVAQIQAGANNSSAVGVIGMNNNVGVLQAGNNLKSNLVLVGTQGLNVGVIQPNGSIPVNMLIARLPNGGLLIKR